MKCPLKKEIYIYDSMFNKLPTITKKKKNRITFLFIKLSNFTLNKIIIFYNNRTFNSKIGFCLR